MKTLASVLENIGTKAALATQAPRRSKPLLRALGVNQRIARALVKKQLSRLEQLAKVDSIKCCFVVAPPKFNVKQNSMINSEKSLRVNLLKPAV